MSKIIVLMGLPASGKSTKAKEIMEKSGNYVRLNRDLLRTMLHWDAWSPHNERLTIEAQMVLAKSFVQNDVNFIVDDTNLGGVVERWIQFANENHCRYEIVKIDTPIDACIARDLDRRANGERFVGSNVIISMARQNGLFDNGKRDIICDLDGTLCDISHRLKYVKNKEGAEHFKKDWKSFFAHIALDEPRREVVDELDKYKNTHNVCFVSGRPDTYRKETEEWLSKYYPDYNVLLMRRRHDMRPDDDIKEEILNKYFDKSKIDLVIDDRPRVIRMWRKYSLNVLDVGGGIEF